MSKHSHILAIFDNAFQSRAGSPDVYMSMVPVFPIVSRLQVATTDLKCDALRPAHKVLHPLPLVFNKKLFTRWPEKGIL